MEYGVLLYFDEESNKYIENLRNKVTENDVNNHTIKGGIRPHITIASFETKDEEFLEKLKFFLQDEITFDVVFGSIGIFPFENNVVYLAPVLNSNLYNIHNRFYQYFNNCGYEYNSHYKPQSWVPHCTIASHLSTKEILNTIVTLREDFKPIKSKISYIGIIEGNPAKELVSYRLKNG
ncbi:2'-5' RNA ligase family protein [Clostridium sp. D2Q-11]|uniref:2'-5' RNA ligase family protein n=1 Tax=Anaeromonas frigoriresistens TaxID=2683708 RepID=A0A942UX61_9FIRM|nr:2'-5' RNA ligase family protein [Anaeromonas frigoriresistens]MBS4537252.1 2'-5' RNA ligase family protein [Anaeromonas frigoriresistens]